ncbi:MAG: polysaccharide deacetylase family protein [Kiritimatiellae bacterium]|jgi:peptidoglycan/xylan/chitin deacetylase (PgdA/CDA1 family)|nr:polysaccharide deacetylase family protein [Kiritimatiellia bacterium]NLD90136.1 polysaccharide deacetylase family protein [Lentisphaerota bacterium]HQQ60786.1 polysaccharide deacetylase family protein [Kiritimatiellia bacterium]
MKPSIPILCYRNISPVCGIPPGEFRSHLEWLDAHGWRSISLEQLLDYLKGGPPPPPHSYALTFEDDYLDNWVHAAPLLREYGVQAAFGCATAYLHDGPRRPDAATPDADLRDLPVARDAWGRAIERNDPTAFMNRAELRALVEEQGHGLFGHTHTHQACFRAATPLDAAPGDIHPGVHGIYLEVRNGQPMYPSGSAYAHNGFWPAANDLLDHQLIARSTSERIEFCLNEFTLCRERLEEVTGRPARLMSWPWGEYDDVAIEAALLAGYEGALSMDCGANRPGTPLFAMRRVRMQGGTGPRELNRLLCVAANPLLAGLFRKTYRRPRA